MSFIGKLDFKKSKVEFADGRKMLQASLKGKFNRDQLSKNINGLAKEINSKHVQLGISAHYKNVDKWTPSLISNSNGHVPVWDPSDSPDTQEAYENDEIDFIHVFVIEDKKAPEIKRLKPKNNVMFK
jgi:hypothetical protein